LSNYPHPFANNPASLLPAGRNRTRYYDQYGVIRDMHQNHLTEILALVAMEIPGADRDSDEEFLRLKKAVVQTMQPVTLEYTLLGQYGQCVSPSHILFGHLHIHHRCTPCASA